MRATLYCRTGELAGQTHVLTGDHVIGRSDSADVSLNSDLISAHHARIHANNGVFTLEDLGD